MTDPILTYLRGEARVGSHNGYIMRDGEWIPLENFNHKVSVETAYMVANMTPKGSGPWEGYEKFLRDYKPVRVSGWNGHDFLCTAVPTDRQLETAAKLTIKNTPNDRDVSFIVWGATRQKPDIYWHRKFEKMIGRKLRS